MENFEIGPRARMELWLPGIETPVDTHRLLLKQDPDLPIASGLRCIRRLAERFCKGAGLDVGPIGVIPSHATPFPPFPGAVPVDIRSPGTGDAEQLIQADATQDFYFSSHCWEHCSNPEKVASEAFRVLRPGGCLFLYLPYPGHPRWDPSLWPAVLREHPWQPTPNSVARLLLMAGFEVTYTEHEPDVLHSFVVVARRP